MAAVSQNLTVHGKSGKHETPAALPDSSVGPDVPDPKTR
jgi:hypothetical protein